jgi:cysteine desulfuration protein SufE
MSLWDLFDEDMEAMERLTVLMTCGKALNALPMSEWNDRNEIPGCQSRAHLEIGFDQGFVLLQGASNSMMVQGLLALMIDYIEGMTVEEVIDLELDFLKHVGPSGLLTPSRSNGFHNMFVRVKEACRHQIAGGIA